MPSQGGKRQQHQPIRGQYSGHVICLDQSGAAMRDRNSRDGREGASGELGLSFISLWIVSSSFYQAALEVHMLMCLSDHPFISH